MAALGVTEALLQVTLVYGRSFIWNQYFPYAAELAKDALRNLTSLNAAGLLGCMEMMFLLLSEEWNDTGRHPCGESALSDCERNTTAGGEALDQHITLVPSRFVIGVLNYPL